MLENLEPQKNNESGKRPLPSLVNDVKLCDICGKRPFTDYTHYDNGMNIRYMCAECKKEKDLFYKIMNIFPKKYISIETDVKEFHQILKPISLFITGSPGVGKTVFACSFGKKHIRNNRDVMYLSYPAFIMRLQGSFKDNDDSESAYSIAEDAATYDDMLIIDDLGAEKPTEFVKQITYYILNEREQNERLTVITSNFSLLDIDDQIDPRASSRIAGMCKIIKLSGKDRRLEK